MVEKVFPKRNIEEEKRWLDEREEEMDLVISFSLLKGSWAESLESILKSGGFQPQTSNIDCFTFSSQETIDCCNTL